MLATLAELCLLN